MDINKYVGSKIREFRQRKNITQEELADYLHTTAQTISRYEIGDRKTNQDVLFSLANYFQVSIDDFFPKREFENTINKKQVLFDKYDKLSEDDRKFIEKYIIEKDRQIDEQNNDF